MHRSERCLRIQSLVQPCAKDGPFRATFAISFRARNDGRTGWQNSYRHAASGTESLKVVEMAPRVRLVVQRSQTRELRFLRAQPEGGVQTVGCDVLAKIDVVGQVKMLYESHEGDSDVSCTRKTDIAVGQLTNSLILNHEPYAQTSLRKSMGYQCRPTS